MEKKKNNIITEIVAFIISAIVCTGCWLIGYFCVNTSTAFIVAAIASVCLMVIAVLVNLVRTREFIHGATKKTMQDSFDHVLGNKTNKDNTASVQSQVEGRIRATILYALAIMLLLCAACFLMGSAEPTFTDDEGGISLALLPAICVLGQGVVAFLIRKNPVQKPPHAEDRLNKEEYPLIVGLVKDCAKSLGISKKIQVYYTSGKTIVNEYTNVIHVFLNPIEVAYFTADELKADMLHRLARCANKYIADRSKQENFVARTEGNGLSQFGMNALISYPITKTLFSITVYGGLSSREKDSKADKYIVENGLAENYINATAKAALYWRYRTYDWRETGYEVFAPETPMDHFAHLDFKNFKDKLEIYRDRWFFTLYNGLPQLSGSRPSFAMQMMDCDLTDFNVDAVETNPAYLAEQDKLLSLADKIVCESFTKEDYEEARAEVYTERNAIFEELKSKGDDIAFESETEKIKYANAYIGVDNQKALELLNQVLDSSTNSLAYFLKGVILSNEYDDECMEMFNRAAQNTAFFDEAMEYLALYAIKTGNKEVMAEYSKTIAQKKQASMDEDYSTEISRSKLSAPDRNDLVNAEVLNSIKEYWGDALSAVYLAETTTQSGIKVKYFAISINEKKDIDYSKPHNDTLEMLFRYSDEKTKFYLFYNGSKEFNLIKNTPDSLMFSADK